MRKRISGEKRAISSALTSNRVMVGKSVRTYAAAGLFGRRKVGAFNAARRNALRVEQLKAVAPYDAAAAKIDSLLAQIDAVKNQIDQKLLSSPSGR